MERREHDRGREFDPYEPPERYARPHHFAINEDPYSPFPPPPACPPGCEPAGDEPALYYPNEDPADELAEALGCEVCEGPLYYLGPLGRLQYFRCRSCGSEHAFHAEELPEPPEDPYG